MTITAITTYPHSIKSYLVDKAKQSVFNSPVVKTTFVASTVLFTGITGLYLLKKMREVVRTSVENPVQTFCIAGAIFATGAVIAHHPVMSMILFVGLSYMLLNRNLHPKIGNIDQLSSVFYNPIQTLKNVTFKANNLKVLEQLDLEKLNLQISPLREEDVNLNENSLSTIEIDTAITDEQSALEDIVTLHSPQLREEDVNSKEDSLSAIEIDTAITDEEIILEDVTVDSAQSQEEDESSTDHTISITKLAEEIKVDQPDLTIVQPSEEKEPSNDNPSFLEIAKTMKVKQFHFRGIDVKSLNLGNLQPQKDDSSTTERKGTFDPLTFPIQTISPNSKRPGISSIGAGKTKNPFAMKNIDPATGKLIKSYGKVLKFVRIIPK